MPERLPPDLARRIRMVVLDVDGVLTDGGIYMGGAAQGQAVELKRFDITDGLAVKMLARAGVQVVLVSGRESAASRARARELGVECVEDAAARKLPVLEALCQRHGLDWHEIAFLADDLADVPVLRRVGLPVAVANATAEVRALAHWVTQRPGGTGAVREFAEVLLQARGEWRRLLAEYYQGREGDESGR
ncbi:MAG: HAD hydrolase family protein [Gemmatimonadetes bacterium]|nr:HAD hydrolase family protein [Gemmatimonadota bacterium]